MEITEPVEQAVKRESASAKAGWAVLIVLTLYVCYFSHLGAIGLVGPDEPRYAWIARDMAETGDWVTPRLYGKPWFEKPPLYYWEAALSFKLFGVSEAAARLPSALSALLATLALAWLAWRAYGAECVRWLLLLLPTTVGMIGFSHAAATDMPFAAMLTVAMVAAAVILGLVPGTLGNRSLTGEGGAGGASAVPTFGARSFSVAILFGFFLGLAVLAKGPAGIVLSGGAVFLWALWTRRWREALRLLHPIAIAAFCVTALPWYGLCARRNPDFFRVFIVEHNFKRFLTPEFQHIQPWWYYVPILVLALSPWIVWAFAFRSFKRSDRGNKPGVTPLLVTWSFFVVVFFSVSKSKLPGYALPAVPTATLLMTTAAAELLRSARAVARWPLIAVGLLFLAASASAVRYLYRDYAHASAEGSPNPGAALLFVSIVLAAAGGVAVIRSAAGRNFYRAQVTAVISVVLLVASGGDALLRLNRRVSAKNVAHQVLAAGATEVFSFQMQRSWHYQLNFYLHREIPEWTAKQQGTAIVVAPARSIPQLKKQARVVEVVDSSEAASVLKVEPLSAQP